LRALSAAARLREQMADLSSAVGRTLAMHAGIATGDVIVEGIWPNRNFETGIGINAVTSADPGWPNGGAVFHDTAVWIKKA